MNTTVADKKLYDALNVNCNATKNEIKKAFRKLALEWHPDKWTSGTKQQKIDAESKFKEITEAYGILSDPEKREKYNQYGGDAFKNGGAHDMSEADVAEMFSEMGGFGGFGSAFGGFGSGFGGRGHQHKKEVTIPDLIFPMNVDIKATYMGSLIEFEVLRYNLKTGKQPSKENMSCANCKGKGVKIRITQMGPGMLQQSEQTCDKCAGEGILFPDEYFDKKIQAFSRTLPKGIVDGEKIVIEDKGHEIPDCFKNKFPNRKRTNIILVISESRELVINGHKYIRGVNKSPFNLALDIELEPHEAICGTYKYIPFINGENICVKIPPGTIFYKSQQIVVIPQLGMPFYNQKGSFGELFVILSVKEKFTYDDDKLKKIWKDMTGSDMTHDNNKVLSNSKNTFIESMSVEDYKISAAYNTTEKNHKTFNKSMANNNSNTDDSDQGHGRGRGQSQGPNGCAHQ
jgi:DnaJ-class molecular chaperone